VEGAVCYVTSRAVEGGVLFKDAKDYQAYRDFLATYQRQFGIILHAFALLPDQLHLCLELAGGTSISTVMHALNSRYTKYFTARYEHTGHVFQERYKLTLAEKAPSLLRLTGYVHTAPLRAGVAEDLAGYRWSSYPCYLAAPAAPSGQGTSGGAGELELRVDAAETLELLQAQRPGWTYTLYLQSMAVGEWASFAKDLERPVVGSGAFLAEVERRRGDAETAARAQAMPAAHAVPMAEAAAGRRPWVLTASMAMAAVALVAAVLSTRNVDALQKTLNVLTHENQRTFAALTEAGDWLGGFRLATFSMGDPLTGTWEIQMRPLLAGEQASTSDRLTFDNDKVRSEALARNGFPASHFTIKRHDDRTVWEAAQIGPGGELVNWHGESDGPTMRGTFTRQLPGQPAATYRFVGVSRQDGRAPRSEI
jgi:REP element-mobilizing transposase RayT